MQLLIIYETTEGQTKKICEFLKTEAEKQGHKVVFQTAIDDTDDPDAFDAIVIAASLHAGRYQTPVEHYIKEHHETLNSIPSVFLSVSLTAAVDEEESRNELEQITQKFLAKCEWSPTHVEQVAGALLYTKYNFFKKFIMRLIAQRSGGDTDTSGDYEYTDWEQVKGIVTKLEADLDKSSSGV